MEVDGDVGARTVVALDQHEGVSGMKRAAAAAVAVAMIGALTACGSGGGAARTSAPPTSATPSAVSSVSSTTDIGNLDDQVFLAQAEGLISGESDDDLIKTGKLICQALEVDDSYDDAVTALSGISTDPNVLSLLIGASAKAYCPQESAIAKAGASSPTTDAPVNVPQYVHYKVTGTSGEAGVITYTEGANSSIEQSTNASLPWKKRVTADGTFFSLSAQNSGGGSITCEIDDADGTVLDKHTARGEYAIADCQSS
jgi:hypothetical protein